MPSKKQKLGTVLRFEYVQILFFIVLIVYGFAVVDNLANYLEIENSYSSFYNSSLVQICSAILIAPIIEEIVFRNHLSGSKKDMWSIILIIIFGMIMFRDFGIIYLCVLGLIIILFTIFYNKIFWLISKKYYWINFILTAVLFCLFHINQIETQNIFHKILFSIIAFLPLSIFLGLIRKKYGIISAMVIHSLRNLIVLILNGLMYFF